MINSLASVWNIFVLFSIFVFPPFFSLLGDDRCYSTRCAFGCVQYDDGFNCFCPDGLRITADGLGCEGNDDGDDDDDDDDDDGDDDDDDK